MITQAHPLTGDHLAQLGLDHRATLKLVDLGVVSKDDAIAYLREPNRKATPPKKRTAKRANGKVPAWARPIEELIASFVPVWLRPEHPKKRNWTKRDDKALAEWIAEHPDWVAGRLRDEAPKLIYYSYVLGGKLRFNWLSELARDAAKKEEGFVEYDNFAEWKTAIKLADKN